MDVYDDELFQSFKDAADYGPGGLEDADFDPMDVSDLIRKFLENRGLDHEAYQAMDADTASDLLDLDLLCRELQDVRASGGQVTILPDFDMDGITSGVIGVAALSQLGFSVELYVPDPAAGYGFDEHTIDDLMQKHPHTSAILTCDTGIGCRAGVIHAKRCYGLRVLVTDHHVENIASTTADVADACVDPCRLSDPYPMKSICGAHVMWKVMYRYAETYRPSEVERIHLLRVFAGLGTISDMMELAHENRQLVRDAVSVCRLLWSFDWYREMVMAGACPAFKLAFEGLIAVLRVWTEKVDNDDKGHKISRSRDIDEGFFGYYIAPMFNAAKRLNLDMRWPFGLFMGWYGSCGDAFGVAKYLYVVNNSRKDTVQLYLQRLHESEVAGGQPFAPYAYVYDNDSAKSGILGLVASSLSQSSGKPVVVLKRHTNGQLSGSGRSPVWYPYLSNVVPQGFWAAGHEGAFGVKFSSLSELSRWYKFIVADVDRARAEYDADIAAGNIHVQPPYDIVIDDTGAGDITGDAELLYGFLEDIESYRPFGRGFSDPVFKVVFDVGPNSPTNRKGMSMVRDASGSHWKHGKFELESGLTALCFGQGEEVMGARTGRHYVVGALEENVFAGRSSLQVRGDLDAE